MDHNAAFAREVERVLSHVPRVIDARASAQTATVLVRFTGEMCDAELVDLVEAAWKRLGKRSDNAHTEQADVHWATRTIDETLAQLGLPDAQGLSSSSARRSLAEGGPNVVGRGPERGELGILIEQFKSTPVALLGASAVLSAATGAVGDALGVLSVLGLNASIGYVTESGAERTLSELTHVPSVSVPVVRDGATHEVPVEEIVRGDLLVLKAGVVVAADARICEAYDLTLDESSLTGESVPVVKSTAPAKENGPLGERSSMVHRGTLVTGGSGRALVVEVGEHTQIAAIHALASGVEDRKTPMQVQLAHLGQQLALSAGAACVATCGVGLISGVSFLPMLRTAISLAVAAVPEGLPTVAMTTLALGLRRMRREHVVVRRLSSVETLGAVQVICLDKTGTLTENQMRVVSLQAGNSRYELRSGRLLDTSGAPADASFGDLGWLLRVAVLCNEVVLDEDSGARVLEGSPTESALIELVLASGLEPHAIRAAHPLLKTQRRAQARNYMATLHASPEGRLLAVKGRPSEVLSLCTSYLSQGRRVALSSAERARFLADNERMAGRALRVLGLAFLDRELESEEAPSRLTWLGLIGMEDPPREGLASVISRFHGAGIRTVMITGDQMATARAIGEKIGLATDGRLEVVDATELHDVEPARLSLLAQRAHVFARVSPEHKLQIVRALSDAGSVVAMTGDGINDGPALRAADIGIAMGSSGTRTAQEMADLVLEEDQLEVLVTAVEQGRTLYADIRKAVHFLLATNLSEILYTFACVSSGTGGALTPRQLLWINLLTDVFPGLALAVQPPESNVLSHPPRDSARPMFGKTDLARVGREGAVITGGALAAYFATLARSGSVVQARSVGFTSLTFAQLAHALSVRSATRSAFERNPERRDPWFPLAIGGTALLQLAVSLIPGWRKFLQCTQLAGADWLRALAAACTTLAVNEGAKYAQRREKAGMHSVSSSV